MPSIIMALADHNFTPFNHVLANPAAEVLEQESENLRLALIQLEEVKADIEGNETMQRSSPKRNDVA